MGTPALLGAQSKNQYQWCMGAHNTNGMGNPCICELKLNNIYRLLWKKHKQCLFQGRHFLFQQNIFNHILQKKFYRSLDAKHAGLRCRLATDSKRKNTNCWAAKSLYKNNKTEAKNTKQNIPKSKILTEQL